MARDDESEDSSDIYASITSNIDKDDEYLLLAVAEVYAGVEFGFLSFSIGHHLPAERCQ